MTSHNMHNEFVFVPQSIAKKRTFGQKDCTIWETREVLERSGVFISGEDVVDGEDKAELSLREKVGFFIYPFPGRPLFDSVRC